ncbi:homoserine O-succinyltransferase [Ignatzschineria ureiclastica]|uniref:Homoserine O-acetyltransferase n=1 Tax=Ignatzschineria ureiclastica TaxID=472582 RepID=A0A2U2AER3_9GAMM|nr:homoserine O-succinyltransferase [Ignatzschineria ureiclastica]PWD81152.1 homoserine O-succinyltransferase [Ignatzschineria ureiclastica]GGZ96666.1 homoserine O-succinyltransferase [Ignatzschineria ureiclastica]
MPVKIPNNLPAYQVLQNENIFVMDENRAVTQDIRPMKIAILNLMPLKEVTETQLLRVLGNTSLQVEPVFLATETYQPKNTDQAYLNAFYRTFEEIKDDVFDGFIITGAPVETIPFESVQYWDELTKIMEWADQNVFSTLYICWGAQAGLYYRYGIDKYDLPEKRFGVFSHQIYSPTVKLLRGFDDRFNAPHSRHTEVRRADIEKHPDLMILAESEEAGVHIVANSDLRHVYVMGHGEYDFDTLDQEYRRDLAKGMEIDPPQNYYRNNDPNNEPLVTWRSHGNMLFANWLNYCVYQETPYDLHTLKRS